VILQLVGWARGSQLLTIQKTSLFWNVTWPQ